MYEYIQYLGSRAFIGRLKPYNYFRDLNYNWLVSPKDRGCGWSRTHDLSVSSRVCRAYVPAVTTLPAVPTLQLLLEI